MNQKNIPSTYVEYLAFLQEARPVISDKGELYDLLYINSDGTLIRNIDRKRWVKPYCSKLHLRPSVKLRMDRGGFEEFSVCRLVALAYVPNPYDKPIVHHIDGNPKNNDYNNLIWVTPSEHQQLHGLMDLVTLKPYKDAIKKLREQAKDE